MCWYPALNWSHACGCLFITTWERVLVWNGQLDSRQRICLPKVIVFSAFSVLSPVYCYSFKMFYNTVLCSHSSHKAGLHVTPPFSSFQTMCQTLLQTTRPLSNKSFLHEDQPLFSVCVSLAFLPKTLFALICLHTHADRHTYKLWRVCVFLVLSFIGPCFNICLCVLCFLWSKVLCDKALCDKCFINKSDLIWLPSHIIWWEG